MPTARPGSKQSPNPIDLPQRVIFLHIAKTAGTSMVHFFRKRLPRRFVCAHGDFLNLPEGKRARMNTLRRYRFLSGHFGYDIIAPLMSDSYSFTFLRDPVDRVLSFYKFCMHPDMQKQFLVARMARDEGIDGFISSTVPEIVEMLDNQQTWQLANTYWYKDRQAMNHLSDTGLFDLAVSHLGEFSRVGLQETFDRDFAAILADLNIDQEIPEFKHYVTPEPISRESLKASTLETLQNRVALDQQLYQRVIADRMSSTSG